MTRRFQIIFILLAIFLLPTVLTGRAEWLMATLPLAALAAPILLFVVNNERWSKAKASLQESQQQTALHGTPLLPPWIHQYETSPGIFELPEYRLFWLLRAIGLALAALALTILIATFSNDILTHFAERLRSQNWQGRDWVDVACLLLGLAAIAGFVWAATYYFNRFLKAKKPLLILTNESLTLGGNVGQVFSWRAVRRVEVWRQRKEIFGAVLRLTVDDGSGTSLAATPQADGQNLTSKSVLLFFFSSWRERTRIPELLRAFTSAYSPQIEQVISWESGAFSGQ